MGDAPPVNHDLLSGTAGWVALAIYAIGFITAARIFFATCDGTDRGEERFAAFAIGLFWPVVLALFVICGLVMLPTLGVKTRPERQRQVAETAEWERQKLQQRIAELEREAGIRP